MRSFPSQNKIKPFKINQFKAKRWVVTVVDSKTQVCAINNLQNNLLSTPMIFLVMRSLISNSIHAPRTLMYACLNSIFSKSMGAFQQHHHHNHQDFNEMAPSPSDSGISELEAALRDRDSELAYLRQTMEHNEHVIFKVHQVSERSYRLAAMCFVDKHFLMLHWCRHRLNQTA